MFIPQGLDQILNQPTEEILLFSGFNQIPNSSYNSLELILPFGLMKIKGNSNSLSLLNMHIIIRHLPAHNQLIYYREKDLSQK